MLLHFLLRPLTASERERKRTREGKIMSISGPPLVSSCVQWARHNSRILTPILGFFLLGSSIALYAQTVAYTAIDLGTQFHPSALNETGQIVGSIDVQTSDGTATHAALLDKERIIDLGTLGGRNSRATAINNSKTIVGSSDTQDGTQHAFLFQDGQLGDLGSVVGINSSAYAINDAGQVAGSAGSNAFLYSQGVVTDLGSGAAYAINNNGQVAGVDSSLGFLYSGGTRVVIYFGPLATMLRDINDSGQIAAFHYVGPAIYEPVLYSNSVVTGVAPAAPCIGGPCTIRINNAGQIVGAYILPDDRHSTAFLYQNGVRTALDNLVKLDTNLTGSIDINNHGDILASGNGHSYLLRPASCSTPQSTYWRGLGGTFISNIAVAAGPEGCLEAYGVGTDNALWHAAQIPSTQNWSSWTSLGGASLSGSPSVAANGDGRLEVFITSSDGILWNIGQSVPGSWSGSSFQFLAGGVEGRPAVVRNDRGILQAFVRSTGGELAFVVQNIPGSSSYQPLISLGGTITSNPAAALGSDGSVEVFATGTDQALWKLGLNADGAVSPWTSLGGSIKCDPKAIAHAGSVYTFVRGGDDALWFKSKAPGSTWSEWAPLGGRIIGNPEVTANADGRLEAFVLGSDNALWHISQSSPGSSAWNQWTSLGGYLLPNRLAVLESFSLVNAFALGGDQGLWEISQTLSGSWE
jgi:probable HAF family extracellular repeat protein